MKYALMDGVNMTVTDKTGKEYFIPFDKTNTELCKCKRIYEDNNFIIDMFPEEPMVRVSIFDNCHFKDEVIIRKSEYIN